MVNLVAAHSTTNFQFLVDLHRHYHKNPKNKCQLIPKESSMFAGVMNLLASLSFVSKPLLLGLNNFALLSDHDFVCHQATGADSMHRGQCGCSRH